MKMNSRRRRANDFTDSLTNFRQTFIGDQSHITQTCSEDSLDTTESRQRENNNQQNRPNNKMHTGSLILAGHLANENSISLPNLCQNTSKDKQDFLESINISEETCLSAKLDLNKCINLFPSKCLSEENCTSAEFASSAASKIRIDRNMDALGFNKYKTAEVQCNLSRDYPRSVSLNILSINCPCNEIKRSKSCMTFNDNLRKNTNSGVEADPSSSPNKEATTKTSNQEEIQIIISPCKTLLISKSPLLDKETDSHSMKEDQKCDSISSERSSKEEFNPSELKALLNSLKDPKPWNVEEGTQKRLLRRMSANFYDSPRNFTEQLLTIIEESVINNDTCGPLEYPDISLCRLTEELRKMCKFIEDETVPEWPRSPSMLLTPSGRKNSIRGYQEAKLDSSRKSLRAVATPDKDLRVAALTPTRRNIRNPKKIHRPKISAQSPKLHDSTSTFESLEAFCKKLYPNEYSIPPEEKNWSQSPMREMQHILLTCGSQMASLENSPNVCERLRRAATSTADSPDEPDTVPETLDLPCKLLSHENGDEVGKSKRISDALKIINKQQAGSSKCYEMIDPDDLEITIMYELAKKRQRCLDTVKIMLEIDASSEVVSSEATEARQSSNVIVKPPNIDDSKFMETLITVKRYQNYVEEYKSLLNLLQTGSNTPRSFCGENDIRLKKTPTRSKARLEMPRSPMTRKNIMSPLAKHCSPNRMVISKPRLFVTPGKTPVKRTCNSKRTYFTNQITETSKQKRRDITPQKSIYGQIGTYDHVISPVGMYIRSTNPSLMKNLRPKTDEMLLTPRKKQITSSANEKPMMKFRLSPQELKKKVTQTAVKDKADFLHPKVHYKLPSHVHRIKGMEDQRIGDRMNELLRIAQDKVVIRHEGRAKSVKTDCLEQPEIHYSSVEGSVHIEQTARKTHFSRV